MEDENSDPVGRDPVALLTQAAVRYGLVREGDKPDQNLVDFWMSAVEQSASIADLYSNPEVPEDTVGDIIRAHLFE